MNKSEHNYYVYYLIYIGIVGQCNILLTLLTKRDSVFNLALLKFKGLPLLLLTLSHPYTAIPNHGEKKSDRGVVHLAI